MLEFKQETILSYSLFPKTELKFRLNEEYQKIIEDYSPYRKSNYRSITDFLFCEIFPYWKNKCFEFYYDNGPDMKEDRNITLKEINAIDTTLSELVLPSLLSINFEEYSWEEFKVGIQDILFSS